MANETTISRMKKILREDDFPCFSDEDLEFYLAENNGDENAAIYQCMLIKSEESTVSMPGVNIADSSVYFKRMAMRYRPNNSGILPGDN